MRRVGIVLTLVAVSVAMIVILSGCSLELGLDTVVNKDGSGTIGVRLAADKELQLILETAGKGLGSPEDLVGKLREELPPDVQVLFLMILGQITADWKVEQGTDPDGTRWMSASQPFADTAELRRILTDSMLSPFVDADRFHLTHEEGFFRTKTVFASTADMSGALEKAQEREPALDGGLLAGVLVIENRLVLPGTIRDNNADEIRGNTLVWRLDTLSGREMYAEGADYHWGAIIGVAAGAFVGLVVVLILVYVILRRRRRRRVTPEAPPAADQTAQETPPDNSAHKPPADKAAQEPAPHGNDQATAASSALSRTEIRPPVTSEQDDSGSTS